MNPTTTYTVTINVTPDKVWAILGDMPRHAEWSPTAYRADKTTDGPASVGTVYETHGWLPGLGKDHLNTCTITAYDPEKRLAFDAVDPRGPVVPNDFVITATDGGTKVDRTMTLPKPTGFQGFMWPMIFPMLVKPAIQKNLERFKKLVETGAPE